MPSAIVFRMRRFIQRAFLISVVALVGSMSRAPIRAQQPSIATSPGQSATTLADGTTLLIGGEQSRRLVQIRQLDGTLTTLYASPLTPRAWHTATLLSDGSVLVVGGIDAAGHTLTAPERFVPSTQTFEGLPDLGFVSRARHTATLLTDGRVLLVGGSSGAVGDDADLWDPRTQQANPVNSVLPTPLSGQTARLLGDGRVLISGGESPDGSPVSSIEVFDPAAGQFVTVPDVPTEPNVLAVTAISPTDAASAVPVDQSSVTLRFSQTVNTQFVSDQTVSLTGPTGPVGASLIPAEGGRLLFVRIAEPLQPGSTYQLTLTGLISTEGQLLAPRLFSFRTAEDKTNQPLPADDGIWMPTGADGWRTNAAPSPWQSLPPLVAPAGVTALAGQVLTLNGAPLADVTLAIGGHDTRSDRTGRFLLLLPGVATGHQVLEIEGASASLSGRSFGYFEAGETITAGTTNVLPYTIWMPRLDIAHTVSIPSPTTSETVITTPFIPGLELHLPAGTVIKDERGQVVHQLGITPIPVDRPPFPLAKNVVVPVYFTIQPGGAYVYNVNPSGPKGGQLVYPNYHHVATGVISSFWHYDPQNLGWYVYGWGTVRGSQVFPSPKTRLYSFTGAMIDETNGPPASGPPPGGRRGGDPVDLATGLFVLEKTDLYLPDVIPIELQRTYRPADPASRSFGIGSEQLYDLRLWSAQNYSQADLVLPDGGRIHYVRISSGTGFTDAVYQHTATPTKFFNSTIHWDGSNWDLTLTDGTVYVFGDHAPLQAIRDRFGNTLTVAHTNGQMGNVSRVTSPNGRWIAFTYDANNRITQAIDNIGRAVGYQYDSGGRLWKVTDVAGGVTTYTYDSSNNLLTITDPRSITYLTNRYDANNRVTLQTQADTSTYQFAYALDGSGNVTQIDVTNPRGYITRTTFNTAGYATGSTEAVSQDVEQTTTIARDAISNRAMSIVDSLGRETDYGYDPNGNITSVTRLAGTSNAVTTRFTYEPRFSELTTVTDPLNHITTFTYDGQGHLTTITDPLTHQTTFTYNAEGQPLTITNAANETVTLGYANGDLAQITDPLGNVTMRFVDAAGRLLRVRDPLGRTTSYVYDTMSRVTTKTDPSGGLTTVSYDGNQNPVTLTDANNHTTTWTYDDMDRVVTRTDPLTRAERYTYDANGNLATLTDAKNQVTTYTYDALDRLTLTTYADGSTNALTYDDGDRLTEIDDSSGGTISRAYDDLNRLTSETTPEGTVGYSYDEAGRQTTMDVTGQSEISYAYDDVNRLTGITQGSNVVALTYDDANRRTSLTLPNGIATQYGYDAASQLTSLTYQLDGVTIGDLTYTYDSAGQRIAVGGTWARTNLPAPVTSATYDAANEIAVFGGVTFAYDANGSLTSDGTNLYSWNARNQLSGITGATSASFLYDGDGRRRSKTIGGVSTAFLYDGLNAVQELTSGNPSSNLITGLDIDEYVTRDDSSPAEFLTDALGSTVALTDSTGRIATAYTYDAFGSSTVDGQNTTSAYSFTGLEADANLLYDRARYYSPAMQRFISADPLGFEAGSTNLYEYAYDAPTEFVDPLGLCPFCPAGALAGGGTAAAAEAGAEVGGAVGGAPGALIGGIGAAIAGATLGGGDASDNMSQSSTLGGDDPAFNSPEALDQAIRDAQQTIRDPNSSARERSKAQARLKEYQRQKSQRAHGADKNRGGKGGGPGDRGDGGGGGKGGGSGRGGRGGTSGAAGAAAGGMGGRKDR